MRSKSIRTILRKKSSCPFPQNVNGFLLHIYQLSFLSGNSTFIATSKIGSASRSFSVNTWKIAMPNFFIKISMTKDHCIPFSESTWGTVNKGEQYFISYLNFEWCHQLSKGDSQMFSFFFPWKYSFQHFCRNGIWPSCFCV